MTAPTRASRETLPNRLALAAAGAALLAVAVAWTAPCDARGAGDVARVSTYVVATVLALTAATMAAARRRWWALAGSMLALGIGGLAVAIAAISSSLCDLEHIRGWVW